MTNSTGHTPEGRHRTDRDPQISPIGAVLRKARHGYAPAAVGAVNTVAWTLAAERSRNGRKG